MYAYIFGAMSENSGKIKIIADPEKNPLRFMYTQTIFKYTD